MRATNSENDNSESLNFRQRTLISCLAYNEGRNPVPVEECLKTSLAFDS